MKSSLTDRELNASPSTFFFGIITEVIFTQASQETSGVISDRISAGVSEGVSEIYLWKFLGGFCEGIPEKVSKRTTDDIT